MQSSSRPNSRLFVLMIMLTLTIPCGCGTVQKKRPIVPQDKVLLDYTCRDEDGEVLITTVQAVADDENERRSTAFFPYKAYEAIAIEAGKGDSPPLPGGLRSFKSELEFRLSGELEGLSYNEPHTLAITTEAIPDLPDKDRFLKISRALRRPKERRITKIQYIRSKGNEPKLGDQAFERGGLQHVVSDITDDQVIVRTVAEDNMTVRLPLGKGVVHDRGDHYDIELDVQVGDLVRIGPYLGQISKIEGNIINVDFGHPFGGQILECQVIAKQAGVPSDVK